jgi:hypothetical protein
MRYDYDNDVDFYLDILGFDDVPTKTQLKNRQKVLAEIYNPSKYTEDLARSAANKRYTEVNEASARLGEFIGSKPEKTPKGTPPEPVKAKPVEDVVDIGTVARRDDVQAIKKKFTADDLRKLEKIQEEEIFRTNKVASDVVSGTISVDEATKRMNQIKNDSYNATIAIKNKPKIKKANTPAAVAAKEIPVEKGVAAMSGTETGGDGGRINSAVAEEAPTITISEESKSGVSIEQKRYDEVTVGDIRKIKNKDEAVQRVGSIMEEKLLNDGVDIESSSLSETIDVDRIIKERINGNKNKKQTVVDIVNDVLNEERAIRQAQDSSTARVSNAKPTVDAVEAPKRIEPEVKTTKKQINESETYRQTVQRLSADKNKADVAKLLKYAKENNINPDGVITKEKLGEILSNDVVVRESPAGDLLEYKDGSGVTRMVTETELAEIRKAKMTPDDVNTNKEKKFKEVVKKDNNGDEYVVYEEVETNKADDASESLTNDLNSAYDSGEKEDYFVKLANDKLEAGDEAGADAITSFFTDKFKDIDHDRLYSYIIPYGQELIGLAGTIAKNIVHFEKPINAFIQKVGGKILGTGEKNAIRKLGIAIASISKKVRDDKGKVIDVYYPFEFLLGIKKNLVWGPWKHRLDRLQAGARIDTLNLARYFQQFDDKTQREIVKRIEIGPQAGSFYGSDEIGVAAKYIEDKFMTTLAKLIEAGLISPKIALEYWGRYFPRSINKEAKRIGYSKILKLRFKDYNKVRRDAYEITEKFGQTHKFETEAERDLFALELNKKGRQYTTHDPATPESVEKMGGYKHPLVAMTERYYQEANDIALVRFFNDIADDSRIFSDVENAAEGFVSQVPNEKEFGKIRGKYIHRSFEKNILQLKVGLDDFDPILRQIKNINSVIKGFKTVWEPAVHASNFISNIMLIDASGVPVMPADILDAFKEVIPAMWNKPGEFYKEMLDNGVTEGGFAANEINEITGTKALAGLEKLLDNIPKDAKWIDVFGQAIKETPLMFRKLNAKLSDIYGGSESLGKLIVYKHWRKKGKTIAEATEKAHGALFDYSLVPDWLDMYRKTPIISPPFVTFGYKMLEKLVVDAPKNPATYMKWALLLLAAKNALLSDADISSEDLDQIKPSYVGDWNLPFKIIKNKIGGIARIDLTDVTRYSPIGMLTSLKNLDVTKNIIPSKNPLDYVPRLKMGSIGFGADTESGALSSLKPGGILPPVLYNLMQNRNPFSGNEIYGKYDSMQEKITDGLNYFLSGVGPSWTPAVPGGANKAAGGSLFQKYKKAGVFGKQEYDYQGNPYKLSDALLRTVGTKVISIEPEREVSFRISDLEKEINDRLGEIRTLLTRTGNIPKEGKDYDKNYEDNTRSVENIEQEINFLEQKIQDTIDLGEKFKKGGASFFDMFKIKAAGAAGLDHYDQKMSNAYDEFKLLSAFKGTGGIKDLLPQKEKKTVDITQTEDGKSNR